MRQRVWLAIFAAAIGWGTGDVATRAAFEEGVGPYAIAAARTSLAAILVVAYLLLRRRTHSLSLKPSKLGVIQGVAHLAIPFILITLALQYASAGFVGLLMALVPVVTALFAHVMLPSEQLVPRMFAGLAIATSGVVVLLASGDSGLATGGRPLEAFLLTAVAVVFISYSSVLAKRHAGEYDSMVLGGEQFVVGAIVLVLLAVAFGSYPDSTSPVLWGIVGYLAVATAMPFVAFFWTLKHATATLASLSGYLVPLIAASAGVLILNERLQPGLVWGGLLILVGVVFADRMDQRRHSAAAETEPITH